MTTIEKFKSLSPARQRLAIHAAITLNGRPGGGAKFDESRYKQGRKMYSTYALSLMDILIDRIKTKFIPGVK